MKRRKISKACSQKGQNGAEEVSHTESQNSGPSFADLPRNIIFEILLKLSLKTVAICKCVCKAWQGTILDPEFSKLHFSQAEVYPILRTHDSARMSRILYLFQLEEDQNFVHMISRQHRYSCPKPGFDCKSDIKLETKLKLPSRNLEVVSNINGHCDANGAKSKRCLKLKPKDHKYRIVNSCNGLLCLSQPSENNPVAVCNPVTGEFINLPKAKIVEDPDGFKDFIDCGLGYSPTTNQYKVVRIFKQLWDPDAIEAGESYHGRLAEVHTLGTDHGKVLALLPGQISN